MSQKIKIFFKNIVNFAHDSPLDMAVVAVAFILTAIGMVILAKFVLPVILLIALLTGGDIFSFFKGSLQPIQPPPTLENPAVCWQVTQFFFDVFGENADLLAGFCYMPRSVNEIYSPGAYLTYFNGSPMLKLRLRSKQSTISHEDCEFLKHALQSIIDTRILDGYLAGYLWAMPSDASMLLLKIVTMRHSSVYLGVDVLLTNTPASVRAAYFSDRPPLPSTANDADPLFKGGD